VREDIRQQDGGHGGQDALDEARSRRLFDAAEGSSGVTTGTVLYKNNKRDRRMNYLPFLIAPRIPRMISRPSMELILRKKLFTAASPGD